VCNKDVKKVGREDARAGKFSPKLSAYSILVLLLTLLVLIILSISLLQVLKHMLYLMRTGEKDLQIRVALALAHLCSPGDRKTIFIDNNGNKL